MEASFMRAKSLAAVALVGSLVLVWNEFSYNIARLRWEGKNSSAHMIDPCCARGEVGSSHSLPLRGRETHVRQVSSRRIVSTALAFSLTLGLTGCNDVSTAPSPDLLLPQIVAALVTP